MTGYARIEGVASVGGSEQAWCWELKCVNGRGLDMRFRLPRGMDGLERGFRNEISGRLRRGSVTASLTLQPLSTDRASIRVNRPLLDAVLGLRDELAVSAGLDSECRLDSLLAIPGMVESERPDRPVELAAAASERILSGLREAVEALQTMRTGEGRRLRQVLARQIDELEELCDRATKVASEQVGLLRERLVAQIQLLLDAVPGLSEERLATELALLATKADVREEIDRLTVHLQACRDLLDADVPVGRRLDFLCQEMNREANTICSKSVDVSLTTTGLDLKTVIEQFREQVQNVE